MWILLEDVGGNAPLVFADVSGHVARRPERASARVPIPDEPHDAAYEDDLQLHRQHGLETARPSAATVYHPRS